MDSTMEAKRAWSSRQEDLELLELAEVERLLSNTSCQPVRLTTTDGRVQHDFKEGRVDQFQLGLDMGDVALEREWTHVVTYARWVPIAPYCRVEDISGLYGAPRRKPLMFSL
jgi:hypothetical protein